MPPGERFGRGASGRGRIPRVGLDEQGQATVEYVLMISLAVAMAVLVMKNVIRPGLNRLNQAVNAKFSQTFTGNGLHSLPFKKR